ncbi:hypothetical protein B0J17DRAFT_658600 [Rhizoctonia solani]|nr:hypothetical protein B0J17DRAFT_658600 [Rhizoctonia solani]
MIDYFDGPAGIWPPTVQRRPESGLFNKVIGHPHAQTPLLDIELCQISTSKVGGQGQDGLRWAVLLLPDMNSKGLVDPELDPIIHLPSLDRQCAWLLDPYARMEGREFFQFLDPETLMLRRKLHLQSLVKISCEHMLDTEKLMRKMEGNEEWKDAICCSVTGVADPRSLALGTGLWATALSQVAYGDLRETSPTIMLMRSIIGTELESIGSRQLGLPFLYPGRLNNPSQAAD